jgi:hypothetical protein
LSDGVRPKVSQIDPLERLGMSSFEHDLWRNSGFECVHPTRRAEAPSIACLESVESVLGVGSTEIVALVGGEFQERVCDHDAHDVEAAILGVLITTSGARETGERIGAAGFQIGTENIACHIWFEFAHNAAK